MDDKIQTPFSAFIATWPFNLNFANGGFSIEFPTQQNGVQYPNVCTNANQGNITVAFPSNISVTIPGDSRNIDLNNQPFDLLSSLAGRLIINFPNGGSISFPSGSGASMDPLPSNASMDPLPGFFKVLGKGVTITSI